jgi:hypothetical protein
MVPKWVLVHQRPNYTKRNRSRSLGYSKNLARFLCSVSGDTLTKHITAIGFYKNGITAIGLYNNGSELSTFVKLMTI